MFTITTTIVIINKQLIIREETHAHAYEYTRAKYSNQSGRTTYLPINIHHGCVNMRTTNTTGRYYKTWIIEAVSQGTRTERELKCRTPARVCCWCAWCAHRSPPAAVTYDGEDSDAMGGEGTPYGRALRGVAEGTPPPIKTTRTDYAHA